MVVHKLAITSLEKLQDKSFKNNYNKKKFGNNLNIEKGNFDFKNTKCEGVKLEKLYIHLN